MDGLAIWPPRARRLRWRVGLLAGPLLAILTGLTGCRSGPPADLPRIAETPPPYVAREGSGNAFDAYVRGALRAEADDPRGVSRVSFTPGQRAASLQRAAAATGIAARGTQLPLTYEYRPAPAFAPRPYVGGWRLIGRVMAWRIEDAARVGAFDRAIDQWAIATKFGLDLTAGAALEAALGWAIVEDARRALLPYLPRLGAAQLNRLGNLGARLLENRPDPEQMLRHEGENHRQLVQAIQDAALAGRLDTITDRLGVDAEPATRTLAARVKSDQHTLPAYFAGLLQDSQEELNETRKRLGQPAALRGAWPPRVVQGRPWWRFSQLLFTAGRPYLALQDRSLARTRLLVLHARILASVKSQRRAPVALPGSGELLIDPYSGEPFRYQAEKADYRLYSLGSDGRDDGGETDGSGIAPDLVLEDSSSR